MIIEATYEGDGVFKVWPPPSALEAREILLYIKAQDPGNKQERDRLPLLDDIESEMEELQEEAGNHEARADELQERIEEVVPDLKALLKEDDMEDLKRELGEKVSYLESIL